MPISPGTRLGAYDVTAQIGAGGMGEVYRATDTKLNRRPAMGHWLALAILIPLAGCGSAPSSPTSPTPPSLSRWTLSGTVTETLEVGQATSLQRRAAIASTTREGEIVGAVVQVLNGADEGRQATTGDDGRFVLDDLEQGNFNVRASANGFDAVEVQVDLASDTELDIGLVLEDSMTSGPSFPRTNPAWLESLVPDYPYSHQVGNVRVFSDIRPGFTREHAEHLKLVWDFFNSLYARNRGEWLDVYYTTDSATFQKVVPHCPTIFIPGARNLTACYLDYPRWFIVPFQVPDLGTQLHEIGHDFLFATWPSQYSDIPWFVEGTAMYFESGRFGGDGSLTVPRPLPFCTSLFGSNDQQGRLIPLDQLLSLPGTDFLADNERTYSQSCMLFNYLENRESGVLSALIGRINSGGFSSNSQLIATLLDLTGKSVNELEEAYEDYARQQ